MASQLMVCDLEARPDRRAARDDDWRALAARKTPSEVSPVKNEGNEKKGSQPRRGSAQFSGHSFVVLAEH